LFTALSKATDDPNKSNKPIATLIGLSDNTFIIPEAACNAPPVAWTGSTYPLGDDAIIVLSAPGTEITDVPVAHAERNKAGTVSAIAMNVFMLDVIGAGDCVVFGNIYSPLIQKL